MNKITWSASLIIGLALWSVSSQAAINAQPNTLTGISYTTLPGEQVQIRLSMANTAVVPGSFTVDNPARIAFDLPNTTIDMAKKTHPIGIGAARSITAIEAGGRTRVVLNLAKLTSYNTVTEGNDIVITLGGTGGDEAPAETFAGAAPQTVANNVQDIDFRRGEKGEGRIQITLADPNTPVDMKKRGKDIVVTIKNSSVPENLERRIDVIDFATLVKTVDSFNHGNDARLIISATDEFDHIAYQTDNTFTIDVKPVVKEKKEPAHKKTYKGERLSLNFQKIDVRAVLQLIADFTGLNLVTSESVKGQLTLRLKNVPWDQALDIILRTKGLGVQKEGNVLSVAPIEEIAARNKVQASIEDNAPLYSESIQVNYAKASDLAKLIKSKDTSLLSKRGRLSVDQRTNRLLLKDTIANIESVIALVRELDIPVRQVLIESRIVLAANNFSDSLGVRFGVSRNYTDSDGDQNVMSGTLNGTTQLINGTTLTAPGRYNVNLPVSAAGSLGLAVAKLPLGTLVELELSAAQAEGASETVASPRVITSNQKQARIEAGQEVPYTQTDENGKVSTLFKKAVLSLDVTPQITPDDRIIMDLKVNKDEPDFGNLVGENNPPINTQSVQTQVLVDNGETIVLGGIYEQDKSKSINRVPFFGDLPLVGVLFRNRVEINNKQELLIFVTPKIVKESASL
ncbi:MAG: type IV pilus secretin PilQ [Thioalkalispiraceae bacterium]|jgi:type IV pilus assembly protein PilQ